MSIADYGFAIWETFYVTVLSTAFALVLGMPLGVLLVAGDKDGILPLPGWLMHILNIVINILRSVPFLILMICVFPLTRAIVGTTVGTKATIVPLVVAAFPFVARLVETSLRELDEGVAELIVGIEQLYDGTGKLKDGTSEMREETSGMDTEIDEKIDELLETVTGGDFETVSFVSDKNTSVDSVQFVIKTDGVNMAEEETAVVAEPEKLSIWEKFLNLFGLYKED